MADNVLVVLTGHDAGKRADLDGEIEVGSDQSAGFVLHDAEVAPRHALFAVHGSKVRVSDLGSPDGTYVNEARIQKPKRVRPGDRVRIGQTLFELLTAEQAAVGQGEAVAGDGEVSGAEMPAGVVATGAAPLRSLETAPHFVPDDALEEEGSATSRYGPLASWTDARIKRQTYSAAIGLIALSGLAVLLFVLD